MLVINAIHKILTGRKKNYLRYENIKEYQVSLKLMKVSMMYLVSTRTQSVLHWVCIARDSKKEGYKIISVIGDGGITAGMSYDTMPRWLPQEGYVGCSK